MTLFEAVTSGKSVKVTFKGGSEPLSGKIRAMVAANDTDDCRAFAFMDKFEFYEDEIESIELVENN